MLKRKPAAADEEGSSDEQTPSVVDVNFDYYNIDAGNDYHAIQRLFMQLFGPDAAQVKTGPLTELVTTVAEESGVGSTIKMDEEEGSDPYAVLTVISCRDHAGLQGVIDHVLSKTETDVAFHAALSQELAHGHVGLVLSERLVNMPVQVMGPMYKMLLDEMDAAIAEGRDYRFTHYLFLSRVYPLTEEEEEEESVQQPKRYKASRTAARDDGLRAFHAEDDEILAHATHTATYGAGGPSPGRVMLVPGDRLAVLVGRIHVTYGV